MLAHLADISIRVLFLALPAAIVLWLMRRRRTAALEHAVWTGVVCGMLALFAFGQVLPRIAVRIPDRAVVAIPGPPTAVVFDVPTAATAVSLSVPVSPASVARPFDWIAAALYGYVAIALGFLAQFAIGMFLVRRLVRSARVVQPGVYVSGMLTVPVTVGWLRPRIILPSEWRGWDSEKLNAVLAHEGAHVRRRDGLVAAVAHVNRCIFWFHPMAWMLEHRLALLAEQACDESSVALLGDCQRYAHLLLEMAGVVDGSHRRLRRHALTMASSSHIRQRIEALLQEGRTFSRGLTWTGWLAVMLCGVPIVLCAGAVQLDRRAPPNTVLLAQAEPTPAMPASAVRPRFEVASIRPAAPIDTSGGGGPAREGGPPEPFNCGVQRLVIDDARVHYECISLVGLITFAFGVPQMLITGPDWMMESNFKPVQRFDIAGKLPQGGSKDQVPQMFRTLLADRFKLAFHRENKEAPGYALVVDKGGLKLKEGLADSDFTALNPNASSCPPMNLNCAPHIQNEGGIQTISTALSPSVRKISNPRIGTALVTQVPGTGKRRVEAPNTTLEGLADLIPTFGSSARTVDMTGVKGRFQVVLEISINSDEMRTQAMAVIAALQAGAPAPPPPDPSRDPVLAAYQSALQKVGLQLEPHKIPVETIVVDHLEKTPTEN